MKSNWLRRRIRKSEKAIAQLPEWARRGCRWQGGGVVRAAPQEPNDE